MERVQSPSTGLLPSAPRAARLVLPGSGFATDPKRGQSAAFAREDFRASPLVPSRFGYEFSRLRVFGREEEAEHTLHFFAEINEPQEAPSPEATSEAEVGEEPEDVPAPSACPVTAVFVSPVVGPQKAGCVVAPGRFGASKLVHFRIVGAQVAPGKPLTVSEQFKPLEDPYGAFGLITPNAYASTDGTFDDCYKIESAKPLPPDFRLKVEQNHLFNGQIISRNHITYGANSISFCRFERTRGSCDFGGRCKL
jgi:hypothetical protein